MLQRLPLGNRELDSGNVALRRARITGAIDRRREHLMTWTLWAVLLITHGAVSRWAKDSRFYAPASVIADGILIAIALITVDQLQGLGLWDVLRVGVFFVAFGTAGRQLMHSVLSRFATSL
jgi:hypothetical protein